MMSSTRLALLVALVMASAFLGCAKIAGPGSASQQQQQQGATAFAAQTFQLPAPDNSYAVQQPGQALGSGSNVQALLNTIINPVGQALKESNIHIAETVAHGQSKSNPLQFSLSTYGGTNLTGTSGTAGTIAFTYTMGSTTVFTGSVVSTSTSGSFTFPASASSAAVTVTYNVQQSTSGTLTRTVTVANANWGTLTFTLAYANSSLANVTMTGTVSGKNVTGAWAPSTGGFFTDLTGAKQCFDGQLNNSTGC